MYRRILVTLWGSWRVFGHALPADHLPPGWIPKADRHDVSKYSMRTRCRVASRYEKPRSHPDSSPDRRDPGTRDHECREYPGRNPMMISDNLSTDETAKMATLQQLRFCRGLGHAHSGTASTLSDPPWRRKIRPEPRPDRSAIPTRRPLCDIYQ